MGIHREVKEWYTCDVCKEECVKSPQTHRITKNRYMDMKPSEIEIAITYTEPMEPKGFAGLVCKNCQINYLRTLVQRLEGIGKEFQMQN